MTTASPILCWFREDLRLADNPALCEAAKTGQPIICLFIREEAGMAEQIRGAASNWWLHHSLISLSKSIENAGNKLILRSGAPEDILLEIARSTGTKQVHWNRRYTPDLVDRDGDIKSQLEKNGILVNTFNGRLLYEPWEIKNKSGTPYKVFTPFWKAMKQAGNVRKAGHAPTQLPQPEEVPKTEELQTWGFLPTRPNWAAKFGHPAPEAWEPGEKGAQKRLSRFLDGAIHAYATARDRPDLQGTSGLSPHLHFGEISPVQIWHATFHGREAGSISPEQAEKFLSEIAWREFAHALVFNHPQMLTEELMPKFKSFPWATDREKLSAWQKGATGYPMVDAAMRELWQTGWMHNRSRMIVGSFLVKHLLLDWREGLAWFHDTLVDADAANNTASWQWIAGCGADAAPYFRIFNPVTQGQKFDPQGEYVRKYVPEIAALPNKYLHNPWNAPETLLQEKGIILGKAYPKPIVHHDAARKLALAAYAKIK